MLIFAIFEKFQVGEFVSVPGLKDDPLVKRVVDIFDFGVVLAKNYSPLVSKLFGTLGLANLVKIDGKVRTDSHPLANATMGSDKGKKAALKFANDCSYPVNERDKEVSDDEAKEKKIEVKISVTNFVLRNVKMAFVTQKSKY